MSETSPTDQVDDGAGSASADLPDDQHQQPSADEQQPESVSGGDSQDADQPTDDQPQSGSTGDEGGSSDDDGLTKFAKSQGIDDVSELSDRERQLLKTAHDNQKAFRTSKQEESDKLKDTVEDVYDVGDDELEEVDEYEARELKRDAEIAQLKSAQRVSDFYLRSPEAKEYDKEMTEIVLEEAEKNGKDAARYLSRDLNRLLVLAKARRGLSPEDAKNAGAREERERLRQRQEATADGGQAQQPQTSTKKVTREAIAQMGDEEYAKFRESGELDAAIARGDLY